MFVSQTTCTYREMIVKTLCYISDDILTVVDVVLVKAPKGDSFGG